jgi:hypothetical protein
LPERERFGDPRVVFDAEPFTLDHQLREQPVGHPSRFQEAHIQMKAPLKVVRIKN